MGVRPLGGTGARANVVAAPPPALLPTREMHGSGEVRKAFACVLCFKMCSLMYACDVVGKAIVHTAHRHWFETWLPRVPSSSLIMEQPSKMAQVLWSLQ